jgi:hypothetical protein
MKTKTTTSLNYSDSCKWRRTCTLYRTSRSTPSKISAIKWPTIRNNYKKSYKSSASTSTPKQNSSKNDPYTQLSQKSQPPPNSPPRNFSENYKKSQRMNEYSTSSLPKHNSNSNAAKIMIKC